MTDKEEMLPAYWNALVERKAVEHAVEKLIGEKNSEGTAMALRILQTVRSMPQPELDGCECVRLVNAIHRHAHDELPPVTEGVYDPLCKKYMPRCICIGCAKNYSDGQRICCVAHRHDCLAAECPDYERKGS